MASPLYLLETRAARAYICPACGRHINKGEQHFRHDPHWAARAFHGHHTTHWCRDCILASAQMPNDSITGRLKICLFRDQRG